MCILTTVLLAVALAVTPAVQQKLAVSEAIKAMAAESLQARHSGLKALTELIQADPGLRANREVQRSLATLLASESQRLRRLAAKGLAEDDRYLSAYHDTLVPAVMLVLPYASSDTEKALVAAVLEGFFNTGSIVATRVASVGETAIPLILELARSASPSKRSRAYDLLGRTLAQHAAGNVRWPLTSESESAARHALLKALRDEDIVCRREAVAAVATAGMREALPLLRELATNDPDEGRPGIQWNSVRGRAAKAIAELSIER